MILPSMGVISEIMPCFSRKRIFGYKFVALSSISIAVFGFLVWAHHMFVAGISLYAALIFSALSYHTPVIHLIGELAELRIQGLQTVGGLFRLTPRIGNSPRLCRVSVSSRPSSGLATAEMVSSRSSWRSRLRVARASAYVSRS